MEINKASLGRVLASHLESPRVSLGTDNQCQSSGYFYHRTLVNETYWVVFLKIGLTRKLSTKPFDESQGLLMNLNKSDKKGVVYYWKYWTKGLYKSVPRVDRGNIPPHEMIEASSCFNRSSYQLHSVLILQPTDTETFRLYGIEQANDNDMPLLRETMGSIQVFKATKEIWIRWGSTQEQIREFNRYELTKLLDMLENASLPLKKNLILDFSNKTKSSKIYSIG